MTASAPGRRLINRLTSAGSTLAFLLALAGSAQAGEAESPWTFTLGGGVGYGPIYEGADEYDIGPLPFIGVDWKDTISFSLLEGLRWNVVRDSPLRVGVGLGYNGGRDEKAGDKDRLRGLGDIDGAATVTLFGSYAFAEMVSVSADLTRDLGGANGLTATLALGAEMPVSESVSLSGSVSTLWADDNHMQEYFGVTARQAQQSKAKLKRFNAESGFKRADVSIGATWAITPSWSLIANGGVGVLLGNAADSPISREDTEYSTNLGLLYRF